MNDLVKRLRAGMAHDAPLSLEGEAADYIEELEDKLTRERERIAAMIEAKVGLHMHSSSLTAAVLKDIAMAIKEGKTDE